MNKLTVMHIIIIGVVVAVIVAVAMWYFMIKPAKEETETTSQAAKTTRDSGGTQEAINQKKKELAKTEVDAAATEAKWKVNRVKYMPDLPYTDKTNVMDLYFGDAFKTSTGAKYGFRDVPTIWGKWITAWYDAQKNQGVERTPDTVFPIAEFEPDPNKLTGLLQNHLTFPADGKPWPVKLNCKTFDDALNHLKRFNNMERHGMPVINNVTISGPAVTGTTDLLLTYDLALYIIPNSGPPVSDTMISGAGGSPGGATGFGGGAAMPGSFGAPGGLKGGKGD